MQFSTDNVAQVTAVIRRLRLRPNDTGYAGELRKFYDNPGLRACYFRRDGLTVDDMCEAIWSDGLTVDRPRCDDFLAWFETVCTQHLTAQSDGLSHRADYDATEKALVKARKNRSRLFQCPECGQKVRGTRATSVLCGECRDSNGPIAMRRIDLVPEEVTPMSAAIAAMDAPF